MTSPCQEPLTLGHGQRPPHSLPLRCSRSYRALSMHMTLQVGIVYKDSFPSNKLVVTGTWNSMCFVNVFEINLNRFCIDRNCGNNHSINQARRHIQIWKTKTKQNKTNNPQKNKTGVFTLRNNCFWVSMEASATHLSFLDCAKSVQLPIHISEPLVVRDVHVHLMCVTFQAWFFQCLVNVSTTFRVATPCGLWNCSNELHVSLPVCIRKKNWTWEQKWSQFA